MERDIMRDSFATRGGVEYVEKDGTYVQTYPEPVKPEPLTDWEKDLLGYNDPEPEPEPLDVWLRIPDDAEKAEAEANIFQDGDGYRADWSLTAVGLVKSARFETYGAAASWLTGEGFQDFTS